MQNLTEFSSNSTSPMRLSVIIKVCVVVPFFCIFLFCMVAMLHIFASHRQFLESTRYILFSFMLVNDSLQLLTSVLLFLFAMARLKIIIAFCTPLLFLSIVTFQNTPLILATMSLERYTAIFHPLHRPAAWRSDRIWITILFLVLVGSIFPVVDFSISRPHPGVDVLSTLVFCKNPNLMSSPVQTLFRVSQNGLFFVVVAVVILFTYIRILLQTRSMRQGQVSAAKAMHTVLLHGFQLLLCMMAFTLPITESLIVLHHDWLPEDLAFFNYFSFILIPRFLSPLIYGLRDQGLRGYMRRAVQCCRHRVRPNATGKPHIRSF